MAANPDPHLPGPPEPTDLPVQNRDRFITMCAWCERVRLEERWVAAEVAIRELRTFEWPDPPLFTHGICDDCFSSVSGGRVVPGSSAPAEAA